MAEIVLENKCKYTISAEPVNIIVTADFIIYNINYNYRRIIYGNF